MNHLIETTRAGSVPATELPDWTLSHGITSLSTAEVIADAQLFPDAAARRLGWLLDVFGTGAPNGLADYCASLASEPSFLSPASVRTGKLDTKWRIVVNEEVDPDI